MKRYLKWMILALVIICLAGCKPAEDTSENKQDASEEQTNRTEDDEKEDVEEDIEDDAGSEAQQTDAEITVYYTNDNGDIETKSVMIPEITPENVWDAIKSENNILADSELISCNVDDTQKMIDLDLNKSFGEILRSVGTSDENNIIAAVVNTYLDAFECQQIKISEEGSLLSSSHKDYDKYMEKRE